MFQNKIIKEESLLLNNLVNQFNSFPKKAYQNGRGKSQSAVCMIFRFNPKIFSKTAVLKASHYDFTSQKNRLLELIQQNDHIVLHPEEIKSAIEIMFIKRAESPRDLHSGQVAFPGGKCEKDEDDFAAAVREAQEEVGITLDNASQYVYLGKYPRNFYAYTTSKGKLFVSIHMFFQIDLGDLPTKKNPDEIAEIFWLPFRYFLNANLETFQNTEPVKVNLVARLPKGKLVGRLAEYCSRGLETGVYRHMKLPNNSHLWGLTFSFMIYFLGSVLKITEANPKNCSTMDIKGLEHIVNNGLKYEFIYSGGKRSIMGLGKWLVDWTYYKVRVKQFEVIKKKSYLHYFILIFLLVLGPVIALNLSKL